MCRAAAFTLSLVLCAFNLAACFYIATLGCCFKTAISVKTESYFFFFVWLVFFFLHNPALFLTIFGALNCCCVENDIKCVILKYCL